MGGSVGVTKSGRDSRGRETRTSNDSSSPSNTLLVDGLSVGQLGLDAGKRNAGISIVDVNLDLAVEIGNRVGDV